MFLRHIFTHITSLVNSTDVHEEADEVFITKLALSLSRGKIIHAMVILACPAANVEFSNH